MDRAICATADRLAPAAKAHDGWQLEREFGLTPGLLAVSHLWRIEGDHRVLAIKGAPEAVAMLCRLDAASTQRLMDEVGSLAAQGLRVLAVAAAQGTMPLLRSPVDAHPVLLGLIAFEDPIRPSVPNAVAQAAGAGVTVAMITGDHASTALAIAHAARIDTSAGVLTGDAIEGMDDRGLRRAVQRGRVFARVLPHQKLRLVQAFKANGEVVAMTGDGVNDAPALKAAHIGVAMGVRGTDVAREASDIVLLDEDFGRIVDAVRMGRRICDNLRKVMTYITAIHVPIAGLALLPLVFGLPPLLLPVHVVLTEMVVDPICSIAFESAPEDPDIMRRAPRPASQPLVGARLLALGLFQGLAVLAASFGTFAFLLAHGETADAARAVTIIALTAGNLALVWINAVDGLPMRLWLDRGLRAFWIIAGLCALVMSAALTIAPWRDMLHFSPPGMDALVAAIGLQLAVAATLGWISQRLQPRLSAVKPRELEAA
jgi:Ca2+-transporting ATPase